MYKIIQHESTVVLGIPIGAAAIGVEIHLTVVGDAAVLDLKESRIFFADHVEGFFLVRLHRGAVLDITDIIGQNQAVIDGGIVIISRNGHKDVPVRISHSLIDEVGEILHLAVHRYLRHVQGAFDHHVDAALFLRYGHFRIGNGSVPLEKIADTVSGNALHGHTAGAKAAAVVFQIVLGVGDQFRIVDLKQKQLGRCQHAQIFHAVHHHPIQIVGVIEIGEVIQAGFAVIHQLPIACLNINTVDNGAGIVIADLHKIQIVVTHGHTLGGIAFISLAHLADGVEIIIIQDLGRIGFRGKQKRPADRGGNEEKCTQFFHHAVHIQELLIFHDTRVLYHTEKTNTRADL